ncbi:MAG: aldehyde dehydrogenase [Candidatus Dormibacteraeota bacterium]|nr:aldehyde dehydrogenase [Candidatus Dormibacteraeota bacterium]
MATTVSPEVATYQQYIDGEWVGAADGATYEVLNPSTEEVMATAPAGSRADSRRAVAAARRAFDAGEWRLKPQLQRSQIMFEIVKHLEDVSDGWALVEAQNAGAVIRKASVIDVPYAVEWFRSMAEQALHLQWYEPLPWIDMPYVSWNFVSREPVGVCAGIVPWNYPLVFAMWKIAPALATGNSVVLKPAPQTPLSALELVRAIDETGLLPKGVLNVVTGDSIEVGAELVESPDVDKLAFTGSTATGRKVLAAAAPTIKKVTLELGGKSASIVCPDADLDIAVDGTLVGVFLHQGQMCESGTRLFVHDDIYDRFVDRLVDTAAALTVGDAASFDSQVGPVIDGRQYRMILDAVSRARDEGAVVATGGVRAPGAGERGHFIQPTVLVDVPPGSHAATEEIFGPVLSVQRWNDLSEVVERANRSIYGLAGGVWSRDTRGAIEIARQLRTGTVWINDWHLLNPQAPFGGFKQSGIGREHGVYGLREYTEVKHVYVDQNVPRRDRYLWDVLLG